MQKSAQTGYCVNICELLKKLLVVFTPPPTLFSPLKMDQVFFVLFCLFWSKVVPSSVGLLHIQSDGKCVYSNRSPWGGLPSYIMSHTDKVVCDITDLGGNYFQVSCISEFDGTIDDALAISPLRAEVPNLRPAGRLWPAFRFCPAP